MSRSTFQYDNRGQVYSERDATFALAYNTDGTPKSAAPGQKDSKPTNYWHDNEGNVVCASTPGQASQKYEYDAANRVKVAYVTDNAGGNPFSVAGDHILEQTEFQYNGAGQVLFTISRQRQDDGSMRSSYVANWYDLGGRLVQTTDFGTNGGSAMSYPADRSSYSRTSTGHGTAFLTTTCNYPDAKTVIVTDPKGIQTLTESDALGRTIRRISDYTDGIVTASSNQTVTYEYDGLNHVIVQTQLLPSNGSRATTYDYAAQTDSFPSKDLLRETHIQNLDGSTTDIVMTYDHGRLATQTTSSGTGGYVMHTYGYDALGRQESDTATTTRTDVDMSIDKLTTGYDLFGRPNVFTSWDGDTIKNQVVREYGAWGQVTAEHQAHGWAVTDSSPVVKYGYTGLNLTSETYPLTGRVVGYTYGSAGSINSRIGRVAAVTDRLSGGTAATVESYTYLGLGAIVQRTQNSQQVTAVYGLDNFGRTNSLTWSYTGSSPATLEQVTYGYDADSNLLYENNVLHGSSSGLYKYDSLGRMSDFYRQAITFSGGQPVYPTTTATESYGLDASSQWTAYSQSGGTAVDLTESSNGTAVKQSLGDVVSADTSLLHATFKYDAWDRLVDAQTFEGTPGASTQTARETYSYDALGRMIVETVMSGTYFTYERFVHDRYYSAGWQVIEEQVTDRTQTVATIIIKDNVWSVAYKDAMIFQQVFSVSGQTVTPGAITYALQNANWDVTAIMASGAADVSARFVTDPYGAYTTLNADWSAIVSPDPTPLFDFHHQGLEQNQDQGAVALYYNCNRMYAFQIGQFLQTDPARQGLNWRAYQSSSPAGRTDQFGLDDRPWYQVIGAQFADGWSAVREAADYGTWTHEATSSHGQAALRGTAQVGASILIFPKDTFQKAAFDIQSCWGLICWWGGDASVLANTGNEAADRTVNEAVAFDKKINGLIANGNSLNAGGELGKQTAKQFPVANTVVSIYESLAENNWTWTYDTTQSGVRSAEGDAITLVSGKVLGKVGNARLTLTAVPGSPTGLTGPVVFRAPRSGATAAELRQIEAYTAGCNEAQRAGALSPTGRVSTRGTLERQGGMAAAAERARASATGSPYSGQAGHVPDTTWTGNPQPQSWLDLTRSVNSSLGAQARLYPIGYQPTKFIFSPPIMPYSPLYGNIFPFLMKPAFAPTSQPASGGY